MRTTRLPRGSYIQTQQSDEGLIISWKNSDNRFYRTVIGSFLFFWLGGWLTGEISVTQLLWLNYQEGKPVEPFLLFWLMGWTVGGIVAAGSLLAIIRGPSPSRLVLGYQDLKYQRGRTFPGSVNSKGRLQQDELISFLIGSKLITARRGDVSNLRLTHAKEGLKVTFDLGVQRIEVGESLLDPEKEWLYETLEQWLS